MAAIPAKSSDFYLLALNGTYCGGLPLEPEVVVVHGQALNIR
jgi:hypothetical protein